MQEDTGAPTQDGQDAACEESKLSQTEPENTTNPTAAAEEETKQPLISKLPLVRQPHHRDASASTTEADVIRQYEKCMREATSITICNYASLNMAINMGFSARNQIASDKNLEERFQAKRGQVN